MPKPSWTWPIRAPLEAVTGLVNSVMDKRKKHLPWEHPQEGLVWAAVGPHRVWAAPLIWMCSTDMAERMVSCSLVKNLLLYSGTCLQAGKNRTFLGNSSPISGAVLIVPLYWLNAQQKWVPYYTNMSAGRWLSQGTCHAHSYSWSYAKSEILQWSTQRSILLICFHVKNTAVSVSYFFRQLTNYQIWKCYLISQIFLFSYNQKTWQKQPVILQLTSFPALRVGKHIAISVCKNSIGIISYGQQMFKCGLLMNEKELFKCKKNRTNLMKAWAWKWNERPD